MSHFLALTLGILFSLNLSALETKSSFELVSEATQWMKGDFRYHISLLVGSDELGGDTLESGAILSEMGYTVSVFMLKPVSQLPERSQEKAMRLYEAGGAFYEISDYSLCRILIYPPRPELVIEGFDEVDFVEAAEPIEEVRRKVELSGDPVITFYKST